MSIWRYALILALSVVLLLGVLIGFASTWVRVGLSLAGIENVAFERLEIGLAGAELRGLEIGGPDAQAVRRIELEYSPSALLGGRMRRMTVSGLDIVLDLDQLTAGDGADEAGGPPPWLISVLLLEDLVLEQSRIRLRSPAGQISIPIEGRARRGADLVRFALRADGARFGSPEQGVLAELSIEGALALDGGALLDRLQAAARLSLLATDANVPGVIAGLDGEGLITADLDRGRLDASIASKGLAWEGGKLAEAKARLRLQGQERAYHGDLTLALDGLYQASAAYAISDLGLEQAFGLRQEGRSLELSVAESGSVADSGRISVGRVTVTDQVESGWFTARLQPGGTPLLSLDLDSGAWRHRLDAEIDPVRLDTPSGRWWARIEDLVLVANGGGLDDLRRARLSIREGRADRPGSNLALTGIESELALTAEGLARDQPLPLSIRAVRPLDGPGWFAPLRLEAALSPSAADTPLRFEGQLAAGTTPAVRLDFSGYHQANDGAGGLDFTLPKLRFDPAGLQPADLSPALRDVLEEARGQLALDGRLAWQNGELSSTADLLIEELGLIIGPARLERVNALLHFDNLAPLTTNGRQELAIGLLEVGLPLTDGLVSMQLDADGRLAVDRLTWRLAGGKVLARPFTLGSDVQDLTMVLDVDQLDLSGLLALTELDGLSGEGRVDGLLPLTISEAGVVIEGGGLRATAPGVLRYRPTEAPGALQAGGASIGLMLQALENFRYDELDITLDGRTDGDTDIGLHLKGANPDLYDGYPVEFNLNLEGDLAHIIRTNLSNYQIPDRIRERIQGFGR